MIPAQTKWFFLSSAQPSPSVRPKSVSPDKSSFNYSNLVIMSALSVELVDHDAILKVRGKNLHWHSRHIKWETMKFVFIFSAEEMAQKVTTLVVPLFNH